MFCSGCGTKNDNGASFCVNCGKKLDNNNSMEVNTQVNTNESSTVDLKSTNLSKASLVCLIIKFVSIFIGAVSPAKWFFELPWLLASLVIAIVSRVKYKDKMSKTLIIVDSILLFLEVIIFILAIILFSTFIVGLFKWITQIG